MTANKTLPKVQLTQLLREALEGEGFEPDEFATYFAEWKALGTAGEFSDPYFGKDGFYDKPLRNNKRVLRHVHLPPKNDEAEVTEWDRKAARGSQKTSDTALIYAFDPLHGYLLIHIIWEPGGHSFSEMATARDATLMNQLADVAEEFIFSGAINL